MLKNPAEIICFYSVKHSAAADLSVSLIYDL